MSQSWNIIKELLAQRFFKKLLPTYLAWFIDPKTHSLEHGGATGGYWTGARFNPRQDWAVVVLYNRVDGDPRFFDFRERLVGNISALLYGEPATPLDFMCEADKRGLARLGMQ